MTAEPLSDLLGRTAQAVTSRIGEMVDELQAIAAQITAAAAQMPPRPERADFTFLRPLFEGLLVRNSSIIDGAGIAYAPGTLAEVENWIEWWRLQPTGLPKFISHDLNPSSLRYYDYSDRDWFKMPRAAGHPVAVGPYVDMGGINVNTVTIAVPARTDHGTHVLGCDISLSGLEEIFLKAVRTFELTVILIGPNARIIASNSPRLVIGTLADLDTAQVNTPLAPEIYDQLPWNLVVAKQ